MDGGSFFIYETSSTIQYATYSEDRLLFSLTGPQEQHFEIRYDKGHRYDDVIRHDIELGVVEFLVIVRGNDRSQAWITSIDSCRKVLSIRGRIVDGCLTSRSRMWLLVNESDKDSMTKVVCVNTSDPHAPAEEQMAWSKLQ
jgi:hypothetical protein